MMRRPRPSRACVKSYCSTTPSPVAADHMGAAKKGLAALVIEWDDGPHAKLDTQAIVAELEKATLNSGGGRAEYRPLGGIALGLRMQANQAACTPLRVAFLSDRPGHSQTPLPNVTYARGVTIMTGGARLAPSEWVALPAANSMKDVPAQPSPKSRIE
jgi:hypothetical protein